MYKSSVSNSVKISSILVDNDGLEAKVTDLNEKEGIISIQFLDVKKLEEYAKKNNWVHWSEFDSIDWTQLETYWKLK